MNGSPNGLRRARLAMPLMTPTRSRMPRVTFTTGDDVPRYKKWNTPIPPERSEEHTSELQSQSNLVCRLLLDHKRESHPALHGRRLRAVHPPLPSHPAAV